MKNSFDKEHVLRWIEPYCCWICGKNHVDAVHHIVGRGGLKGGPESSILNAAPVANYECHLDIHGKISTIENQKILLEKTILYLFNKEYDLIDIDKKFIEKYKHLYSKEVLHLYNF